MESATAYGRHFLVLAIIFNHFALIKYDTNRLSPHEALNLLAQFGLRKNNLMWLRNPVSLKSFHLQGV